MPSSIFSKVVSLPKLKECESHRQFHSIYAQQNPKTFNVPPYRGYVTNSEGKEEENMNTMNQKKTFDLLDSRYRHKNPIREAPHLSYRLHSKMKWEDGRNGKLVIRDLDNPKVRCSEKTEKEYLKDTIQYSDDDEPYDQEGKEFVGGTAISEYNRHFKIINKVESENMMKNVPTSVYTTILGNISRKKLLPMKMNVVKSVGNLRVIDNRDCRLGNKYSEVLVEGITNLPIEKLLLKNNNIRGEAVLKALRDSNSRAKELDLSANEIGKNISILRPLLLDRASKLEKLLLNKVKLSDSGALSLFEDLEKCKRLQCLSLAENNLTDRAGAGLADLLSENDSLKELYLSWNNLSCVSGEPICKALAKNESLKVMDLGWNSLGSNLKIIKKNANSFVNSLCDCLEKNKSIIHFSLGNNGFSFDESKRISEALNKNTTIYGFHFAGNYGYVDHLGYLKFDLNPRDVQDRLTSRQLDGVKALNFDYQIDPFTYKTLISNCCWLCEGWIELTFSYPFSKLLAHRQRPQRPSLSSFSSSMKITPQSTCL